MKEAEGVLFYMKETEYPLLGEGERNNLVVVLDAKIAK